MTKFYQVGGPEQAVFPESNHVAKGMGRLVVVIDPEDREAVERLKNVYEAQDSGDLTEDMQIALRLVANPKPPKPDEPTGLGAVVEDKDGVLWVRVEPFAPSIGSTLVAWRSRVPDAISREHSWSNINVVRVLSPGVPVE